MEIIKDILSVLGNVVNGLSGMIMGLGFGFLSAPTALGYCAGIIGMLVFKTVIPINIQGETIVLAGSVGKNFRERISIVFYSGIIMVVLGALGKSTMWVCKPIWWNHAERLRPRWMYSPVTAVIPRSMKKPG